MSRLSKKQLEERKLKTDQIRATLRTPGWMHIDAILKEELGEGLDKLLAKDDPEARGGVNALKRVMEKITDEIEWGDAAFEEYRKKFLKNPTEAQ